MGNFVDFDANFVANFILDFVSGHEVYFVHNFGVAAELEIMLTVNSKNTPTSYLHLF